MNDPNLALMSELREDDGDPDDRRHWDETTADQIVEFLAKLTPADLRAFAVGMVYENITAEDLQEYFRSGANEEQRKRVLG